MKYLQQIATVTPPLLSPSTSTSQSLPRTLRDSRALLQLQSIPLSQSPGIPTSTATSAPITPKAGLSDHQSRISLLCNCDTASSIIDQELSHNPVLKGLFLPGVGTGGRLKGIRDKRTLTALRTVARFNLNGLSAGQIIFLTSIQLLESLRVGGQTLDLTALEGYLADAALDSCQTFREALVAVCDHVFSVFVEASLARLRDPTGLNHNHAQSMAQNQSQSLTRVRQTVAAVFYFFVVRCSHPVLLVRSLALRYTGRMLDRMVWLVSDSTALRLLLDTLTQLGLHSTLQLHHSQSSSHLSQPADRSQATGPSYRATLHSLGPTSLLHIALLPNDCASMYEISLPLFEMAYTWLFLGMRSVPSELSTVLQEYVLWEQSLSLTQSSPSSASSHVGISLAREAACNRSPVYHIAPPLGDSTLSGPRSVAASKIASELPPKLSSLNLETNIIASTFTAQLDHKCVLRGELNGILTQFAFLIHGPMPPGGTVLHSSDNSLSSTAGDLYSIDLISTTGFSILTSNILFSLNLLQSLRSYHQPSSLFFPDLFLSLLFSPLLTRYPSLYHPTLFFFPLFILLLLTTPFSFSLAPLFSSSKLFLFLWLSPLLLFSQHYTFLLFTLFLFTSLLSSFSSTHLSSLFFIPHPRPNSLLSTFNLLQTPFLFNSLLSSLSGSSSRSHSQIRNLLHYSNSFIPDGKKKSREEGKSREISRQTLLDVAIQSEQDLRKILLLDWCIDVSGESNSLDSIGGFQRAVVVLIKQMWRSAAVVNMLCREIQDPYLKAPTKSVILRIVQLLCATPSVCFSSQIMDCLVAVLQWLIVSDSSLRSVVTVESTGMFLESAKRRLGMFSSHTDRTRSEGEEQSEEISLTSPGSYSQRLKDFVSHPLAVEALLYGTRKKNNVGGRSGERYAHSEFLILHPAISHFINK